LLLIISLANPRNAINQIANSKMSNVSQHTPPTVTLPTIKDPWESKEAIAAAVKLAGIPDSGSLSFWPS